MKPTVQDILTSGWPMKFARNPNDDGAYDGSCFCGEIHGDGFEVVTHCWRGRGRCEIEISGTISQDDKCKIAECIRDNNGWTNHADFAIVYL